MDEGKDKDEGLKARYGVFIPTHGRAKSQITMNMLLDCGFTGDIWLVCDNLDDSLDEYLELYGERVLVFDKREWAMKSDRMTNRMELGTVLYARNYIQWKAKQMGYEVIGVFDDDLEAFSVRYELNGSLQGCRIEDSMDDLLGWVCEFILKGRVSAMSFAHNGGYFGGLEGDFKKGFTRNPAGAWFLNMTDEAWGGEYRGIVDEDFIYNMDMGRTGKIAFKLTDVMFVTPVRGSNDGGHKDMYDEMNKYVHTAYVNVASPNTLTITGTGGSRTNWNTTHSKIISQKWRKQDE